MVGEHQKSGEVAIFTEAVMRGTLPRETDHPRLTILLKYSPGDGSWLRKLCPDALREHMNSED